MRFLGIGKTCDLGALYLRLQEAGHEVRASVSEPMSAGVMRGLVAHVPDWRAELEWIREAGRDGFILFEGVGDGALHEELRGDGFQVIGGSAYGDRLENDRAFGQSVLADLGLPIAASRTFTVRSEAEAYIRQRPACYVLKFNGQGFYSSDNYVGQLADGSDVSAVLAGKLEAYAGDQPSFVLMDRISGVEMGVGAYFDGRRFLKPACLDWEHKRFFAGDMGELTGEMGTVCTYDRTQTFFARTLGLMRERLEANGYVGYINLNTIVNEEGIWPLEFTCRFGYPGFAILDPIQETPWADIFAAMIHRTGEDIRTHPGFSVGVVLTTPPFPYTRYQIAESVGLPVILSDAFAKEDLRHLHFGEVGLEQGRLVTAGVAGWTMVVTGVHSSLAQAQHEAYRRAAGVFTPNLRYRRDIGERLRTSDLARLEALGLLDPI